MNIPLPPENNGTLPVPKYTPPTLTEVVVERIRAGVSLDEAKEYYRFLREVQQDEARVAFNTAMVRAQQRMSTISRDMDNPSTRSRYASLGALDKAIRPHYTEEGLAPMFDTHASEKGEGWIRCVLELSHLGGYSRNFSVDMPADGIGAKGGAVMTRTHATMSAITYGRRALLKMAFNLAEADDDGNAAAQPIAPPDPPESLVSQEQVEKIRGEIKAAGETIDEAAALAYLQISNWGELPGKRFDAVIRELRRKAVSLKDKQAKDKQA